MGKLFFFGCCDSEAARRTPQPGFLSIHDQKVDTAPGLAGRVVIQRYVMARRVTRE
jgi:hypothetical protein